MGRKRAAGSGKASKPAAVCGRERPVFKVPEKETAMQVWIDEVGQELRDVESQIRFFRDYVSSTIHRQGASRRQTP